MSGVIETHYQDGIASLILNRPRVLNALDDIMAEELRRQCCSLEQDLDVRCVVISGAGDNFMAGGDVAFFQQLLQQEPAACQSGIEQVVSDVHAAVTSLRRMAKPVIASVRGAVAGFGVSLMSACDLAIAADDAVFKMAYSGLGISPDGGITWALPRTLGMKRAMEFALLGETMDAHRAEAIGLVNRVVAPGLLEQATLEMAARLAGAPTIALAVTKQLLNASTQSSLGQQLDAETHGFRECAGTADFAEGVNAFCAKRPARFTGT